MPSRCIAIALQVTDLCGSTAMRCTKTRSKEEWASDLGVCVVVVLFGKRTGAIICLQVYLIHRNDAIVVAMLCFLNKAARHSHAESSWLC
jgi:hypothetical protein